MSVPFLFVIAVGVGAVCAALLFGYLIVLLVQDHRETVADRSNTWSWPPEPRHAAPKRPLDATLNAAYVQRITHEIYERAALPMPVAARVSAPVTAPGRADINIAPVPEPAAQGAGRDRGDPDTNWDRTLAAELRHILDGCESTGQWTDRAFSQVKPRELVYGRTWMT
jgi:hypothetical protein